MSAPPAAQESAESGSTPRDSRRQSFKGAIKRIKTVLRRGRNAPTAGEASTTKNETKGDSIEGKNFTSTGKSIGPEVLEVDENAAVLDSKPPAAVVYVRGLTSRQRAVDLFAKYGLNLEEFDWPAPADATDADRHRVQRPIKMRVRITCSSCSSVFGGTRTCPKCGHVRCQDCVRSPVKKLKSHSGAGKGKGKAGSPSDPIAGGVTRMRRSCHKCSTEFAPTSAQVCPSCGHLRCSRCRKELTVPVPWTNVQSSRSAGDSKQDRVYRKPRIRVRWECDSCNTPFLEGVKTCANCKHERCSTCIRSPSKRPKPSADAKLISAVEKRLERLGVEPPAS